MQYCYKVVEGVVVAQAMAAVMQHQKKAFDGPADFGFLAFAPIKKMALDFARLVDGYGLERAALVRIAPGAKINAPKRDGNGWAHFVIVLHSPAPAMLCTCGDETVNLRTGEAWWFDRWEDGLLMNNSGEDVVLLGMDIRVD
jgi:hypothetical protein